jgi:hypothetical protein
VACFGAVLLPCGDVCLFSEKTIWSSRRAQRSEENKQRTSNNKQRGRLGRLWWPVLGPCFFPTPTSVSSAERRYGVQGKRTMNKREKTTNNKQRGLCDKVSASRIPEISREKGKHGREPLPGRAVLPCVAQAVTSVGSACLLVTLWFLFLPGLWC